MILLNLDDYRDQRDAKKYRLLVAAALLKLFKQELGHGCTEGILPAVHGRPARVGVRDDERIKGIAERGAALSRHARPPVLTASAA
jgi:hypothetical protein